ncbi:MAG: Mov34/MPN/PAD-1 family protein [Pyrinomonadaceae bacterium]
MKVKFWHKGPDDPIRTRLNSLSKRLGKVYRDEAKRMVTSSTTLAETEALHSAVRSLTETKRAIDKMLLNSPILSEEKVNDVLAGQRTRLQNAIQQQKLDSHFQAGVISSLVLNLLFLVENGVENGNHDELAIPTPTSGANQTTCIKITSDLIYQIHHNLFPAERMLVASGKRSENVVNIGAVFEVTGKASSGHVRADPEKLARAFIAMELTQTHFALWVHSHPGTGKEWTRPSFTDLAQHEDWLRDYSADLVSAIMVQDRWIRFWGTALENRCLALEVVGPGIIREESHETIFRLEF